MHNKAGSGGWEQMRQTGIAADKTSSSTMVGRGRDGADGSDASVLAVIGTAWARRIFASWRLSLSYRASGPDGVMCRTDIIRG